MKLSFYGKEFNVRLVLGQYQDNDSLYVGLVDEDGNEPFGDVTVNLSDYVIKGIPYLPKNSAYIDTNDMPEIVEWLVNEGIAVKTPYTKRSGYCQYPLVFFKPEILEAANPDAYATYCKQYSDNVWEQKEEKVEEQAC